jgi:hypothetical protein
VPSPEGRKKPGRVTSGAVDLRIRNLN